MHSDDTMSSRLEEAQTQLLESQAYQEDLHQEIEDYKQQVCMYCYISTKKYCDTYSLYCMHLLCLHVQTEFLNSVISDLQNKLEGVEAMKGLHGHMESVSE